MSSLQFHNSTCNVNNVWFDSHKSLIISVCQELDQLDKAKELIEKLLDKPVALKKLKDSGKPKRAKSGWIYYTSEHRPLVMKKHPKKGMGEISKVLGAMWQKTTEKQRVPFQKLADVDKERYAQEMEEYKENMLQFD